MIRITYYSFDVQYTYVYKTTLNYLSYRSNYSPSFCNVRTNSILFRGSKGIFVLLLLLFIFILVNFVQSSIYIYIYRVANLKHEIERNERVSRKNFYANKNFITASRFTMSREKSWRNVESSVKTTDYRAY